MKTFAKNYHNIRLCRWKTTIQPLFLLFLGWTSLMIIPHFWNVYNNNNVFVIVAFTTRSVIFPSFITISSVHTYNNNNNKYRYSHVILCQSQSSTNSALSATIDDVPSITTTLIPNNLQNSNSNSSTNNNNYNNNNGFIVGTDPMTKPKYDTMIGPFGKWLDECCMTLFRNQLRDEVLRSYTNTNMDDDDTNRNTNRNDRQQQLLRADPMYYGKANYTQIVALAAAMNARYYNYNNNNIKNQKSHSQMIQLSAQNVLIALFPKWLPKWYQILFAQPFPIFSAKMNAYVTSVLGVWLMGECTMNDISIPMNNNSSSLIGKHQGVLVTRCRFLEESQCASICIHSCKIPTQNFFLQQMGVPLLMEPNYTTGSCQFSFGRYPNTTTETTMIQTPCLSRCPTSGSYRPNHSNNNNIVQNVVYTNNNTTTETSMCV